MAQPATRTCARAKCRRIRNLNFLGLCPGHGCPTPECGKSKSSTKMVCDDCHTDAHRKVPHHWAVVKLERFYCFLNTKQQVAQFVHPGDKGENARPRDTKIPLTKPSKHAPTLFVCSPQPNDLPLGWESVVAVLPGNGRIGSSLVFYNTIDRSFQKGDPRPSTFELPAGWTKEYDFEGDVYFHDHNGNQSTYDDPRVTPNPVWSKGIPQMVKRRVTRSSIKISKKSWTIVPRDLDGFKQLSNNLTMPNEIDESVRNKAVNRFMDILPNPKTAVRLKGASEREQYINANYVRGFDGNPRHYIAAMGPLPPTCNAFWRMVLENRCALIVMMTGLVEKGKSKCARYWPSAGTGPLTFGNIKVENCKEILNQGFTICFLRVSKAGDKKPHNVIHMWYNTWPDHGVPRRDGVPYPDDLLSLAENMNKLASKDKQHAPIVVHCSAGIGRTGAFLAIDHAMQSLTLERTANVVEIISNLRQDRCAMVQHNQQYDLVWEACVRYAETKKMSFKIEDKSGTLHHTAEDEILSDEQMEGLRKKEKQEAQDRAKHGQRMRKSPMSSSQLNGELRLDILSYKGKLFEFLDVDGDGSMDFREAAMQGMTKDIFDAIDADGNGTISVGEFKDFIMKHS